MCRQPWHLWQGIRAVDHHAHLELALQGHDTGCLVYIDRHIAARHMQAMFRRLPSVPASMDPSMQHLAADGLGGTCKASLARSSAQAAELKGKWHDTDMYALRRLICYRWHPAIRPLQRQGVRESIMVLLVPTYRSFASRRHCCSGVSDDGYVNARLRTGPSNHRLLPQLIPVLHEQYLVAIR